MRNRAKCKLCNTIIESLSPNDRVQCACGEIEIWGGDEQFQTSANNYENFLRIDDDDKELEVSYKASKEEDSMYGECILTRQQLIEMLETQIKNYDKLPQQAMLEPINSYDLMAFMMTVLALFKTHS